MDMPPPNLHAYADVPVIVQSRGAPSPLLVDAVKALGDARALTIRVPSGAAPPAAAPPLPNEPLADEPIARGDYETLIARLRERVTREVPKITGYSITVLDNGGTGGARADAERTFGKESVASRTFANYYQIKGGVPFSGGVPLSQSTASCVIMGPSPSMTLSTFNASGYGGKADYGRATAREFQGWVHWHEVGHCLLGPSETSADTFGLLMQIHDGASRDLISSVATVREANELMSPNEADDYFVTGAAGWLARNYDRLRADPEFMTSDVAGVARMAKGISDRFQLDDTKKADHKMVRLVLVEAEHRGEHFVKGPDGTQRRTDFEGWLAANMGRVPLLGRVLDLRSRLQEGPSRLPKPFVVDAAQTMSALSRMAEEGDPTAKAMIDKVTRVGIPLPEHSNLRSPWDMRDVRHDAARLLRADPPPHDPAPAPTHVAQAEDEAPAHRP